MYNPWRDLRSRPWVELRWGRPLPNHPGATDGVRIIWLCPRLNQVERRSVLTHELIHLDRGHSGLQPDRVELAVRQATARRLITLPALLDALRWTDDAHALADELWVIPEVVADRMDSLTASEAAAVAAVEGQRAHNEDGGEHGQGL